jgi:NitT/TauT family transport system substrate-binding protein
MMFATFSCQGAAKTRAAKTRVTKAGATAAAVAVAAALAGCGAAGSSASAPGGGIEQHTITVDSVPAAEDAGLYVAQANGYFAQQGLTVKINSVTDGAASIPDLQNGTAQLSGANYVSFILAQMSGSFHAKPVDIRIVAAGAEIQPGTEALYVMPHAKYQTVAALARAHATIGLNTANDVGDVMVGALLRQNGYQLSDIKQVIPADGFPALLQMLPAGRVDAAWLPQPLGVMAEQRFGATAIADFDQGAMENFPFTGYMGTAQWVRSHPKTVAAFLRALDEGQQTADTDRDAAEQALEKYIGVKPLVAAAMSLDTYPLAIDEPQLQRVADLMFEFGLTPGATSPYQVSDMVQS